MVSVPTLASRQRWGRQPDPSASAGLGVGQIRSGIGISRPLPLSEPHRTVRTAGARFRHEWRTHADRRTVLVSSAATIDVTSIPSTYKNLRSAVVRRGDTVAVGVNLLVRLNGDTGDTTTLGTVRLHRRSRSERDLPRDHVAHGRAEHGPGAATDQGVQRPSSGSCFASWTTRRARPRRKVVAYLCSLARMVGLRATPTQSTAAGSGQPISRMMRSFTVG